MEERVEGAEVRSRFYYKKAEDTYYQANNWAAYDDWRRARDQWDYFYSRNR